MYELQILFQRRRRMLTRLGMMLVLGVAATLAILPRADAGVAVQPAISSSLLTPHPISSSAFVDLRAPHGTIRQMSAL
jgi:hypothetical protein